MKTLSGLVVLFLMDPLVVQHWGWSSRLSLSPAIFLSLSARQDARKHLFSAPLTVTFQSNSGQIELAPVNLLSCAEAQPAASVYSFSAKTLARSSDFFCPHEKKGSSNLGFKPAWPLTCGSHIAWTYTSGTVYLLCEDSGAKFGLMYFALRENKDSSSPGLTPARPLTYGAHFTWAYTSGTIKHMTVWWYITLWPQNTI
jgi:hypothetical protein